MVSDLSLDNTWPIFWPKNRHNGPESRFQRILGVQTPNMKAGLKIYFLGSPSIFKIVFIYLFQHHKAIPLDKGYSFVFMRTSHTLKVELVIYNVALIQCTHTYTPREHLASYTIKTDLIHFGTIGKLHNKNRFNTAGYFQSCTADLAKRLKEHRGGGGPGDIEHMGQSDAFA